MDQNVAFTFLLKHFCYLRSLLSFYFLERKIEEFFNIFQEIRQMNCSIWVYEQEIVSIFYVDV